MSLFGSRAKPKQKTARPQGSAARRRASGRAWLPWALAAALVVTVLGIGGLKWAETGGGRATLLSLGSDSMYGEVQASLDVALAAALPGLQGGAAADFAPDEPWRDCDWPAAALGPGARVRCRSVAVPVGAGWWQVQDAVAAAVRAAGGRILWGERLPGARPARGALPAPDEGTDVLRLDVGVTGRPTHTLLLHREGRSPRVRWGGGAEATAWQDLAGSEGPVVALVIDDWGNHRSDAARRLLAVPAPLTLAVLPGLPFSRHYALQKTDLVLPEATAAADADPAAARARQAAGVLVEVAVETGRRTVPRARREIMLHLPMEPQSYPQIDPGPDAVMVGMSGAEIAARVDAALAGLPGVTGVNNHMGSAATGDAATMRALMTVLAERDLYFVDSVTSAGSVGFEEARRAGRPAARNRIFLDYDNEDHGRIRANLQRLVQSARATGFAVGIGHPHPATADVLAQDLPQLAAAGVRFVTVSELMALQRAAQKE